MNPYGRSKLMAENILQDFSSANQFRHMILRYFNAAGADIEGKIGENHNPETHLIPLAIRASIDTSSQLELYGLDYPTEDGSAIRDYIHVSDLATAHVKALEYMLQGGACKTFNLGTGAGYSVLQIMKTIELITNKPVDYVIKDRREGDPAKLVADPSLAMRELNWRPDNSEISNIVHSAFLWQKKLLDYA
jgi:UDP-glucose-4-epimerase GalE